MKKLLGATALVMVFSVPALAQNNRGASSAPTPYAGGGGGSGSLGAGGGAYGNRLPSYPAARFATSTASGDASFAPSSFLPFDQAVAEGNAEAANVQKPVGQVAAENNAAPRAKAKYAFVQDVNGKVVPTAQQ